MEKTGTQQQGNSGRVQKANRGKLEQHDGDFFPQRFQHSK
jgi:hypothetical protein